jgi:outer membrane protein TolC
MRRGVPLAMSLWLSSVAADSRGQEPPKPPPPTEEQVEEAPQPVEPEEEAMGPAEGAPTVSLAEAVRIALERNYGMLGAADALLASRYRESAAKAQFYPRITPRYQRSAESDVIGLDLSQKLPWSGATVTAGGTLTGTPENENPFPRSANLRFVVTQPLLRGFGPTATSYELQNSRRGRIAQERNLELSRQRLAVQVTSAFFGVIAQRQLVSVSRQSLKRSESLRKASEARLKIGLASKLDVFRTEIQASQTEDALVRSEAALEAALEQFRFLLALPPGHPLEPEAVRLGDHLPGEDAPVEVLVQRAFESRLELRETRDQLDDAKRSAALARQNLLPQLDLGVGVTRIGFGPTYTDAYKLADTRVSVFVTSSYPLERSSERAASAVAALEVDARERAVKQREMEIESEVRSALREMERIRKSVELQRQGVEIAAQQRRLAVLRYQRGLASNFDVVDAESSLVLARSSLVSLLTSYNVARLELKRVVGSLDVDKEFAEGPPEAAPGAAP